jgi:hypothetical protein
MQIRLQISVRTRCNTETPVIHLRGIIQALLCVFLGGGGGGGGGGALVLVYSIFLKNGRQKC